MSKLPLLLTAALAVTAVAAPAAFAQDGEPKKNGAIFVAPWAPQGGGQGGAVQNPQQGGTSGFSGRFSAFERNAPDREDRTHIRINDHLNGIFGGMGQGAGMGLGLQVTTADKIPGVELSAAAIVSTKLYRQFEVESYFPKVGSENTHADVRFRYRRRTKDRFFGIGPDLNPQTVSFLTPRGGQSFITIPPPSSEDYKTNYDLETRQTAGALFHDFSEDFQAGVYVQYVSASVYEGQDDSLPPLGTFFYPYGDPSGFIVNVGNPFFSRTPVPGLFTGSKILSEGIYGELDMRNTEKALPKGFYAYARFSNHDGIGEIANTSVDAYQLPPIFSTILPPDVNDYGWRNLTFDVRGYIPVFSDRTSLALRYYTELNETKGGAAIPFYDLARLGGGSTLRGFDTFRFHGRNSVLFQGELRQNLWNYEGDEDTGIDAVVFGDAGQVWGLPVAVPASFLAPTRAFDVNVDRYDVDNYEVDFGGGLHFRYKSFVIRTEVAHSNEKTRFNFGFSRAF